MPSNRHLNFFDITDFTKGLWSERGTSELAAPNNAFVQLDDYMPLKNGGMRAFYKSTAVGVGGIGSISQRFVSGLFARNGVPLRTGAASDGFDAFVLTIDNVDFKARLYRMDGANAETTWKLVGTGTIDNPAGSSSGHQVGIFRYFKETGGNEYYIIVISCGGNSGLYKVAWVGGVGPPAGDGVTTKIATYTGPMCISQARIIVGGGNDEKVHYSDVGATTFTSPATQVVSVTPNQGEPNLSIISNIEPADLLIGKEGAPWVEVNGDITTVGTPIRELGEAHYMRQNKQNAPRVPNGGIAFIEFSGRIFVTDGRTFQSISDPIPRFLCNQSSGLVGPGQMAVLNNLLFAPGGLVYDFDTNAWFTSTDFAGSLYHHGDPYGGQMWMATNGASFDVQKMSIFEANTNTGKRKTSGHFRTVPFSDPNGRAVELREVQLFLQVYGTSTAVVKAIDASNNTVSTQTIAGMTGRGMYRALFPNVQDQYVSVDVTISADNGTSEAPTVERMRIGFGAGNIIR